MNAALPVVWIDGAAEARPLDDAPSDDARRALESWARARGVAIAPPAVGPRGAIAVDLAAAERIEQELDRAREATAALDADATERALSRAQADVVAHPELPQAAWLLAEIDRAWAVRYTRVPPLDAARAERLWGEAAGLDGGRASAIGEPHAAKPPATVPLTLAAPPGVTTRIDGEATAPGALSKTASAHVVVVENGGTVLSASWVNVTANMTLAIPPLPACTMDDFGGARALGDGVAAAAVRCGRWIAAAVAEDDPTAVRVAVCERGGCGPLVEWRVLRSSEFIPGTEAPEASSTWPAWASWTIAGVGAAGAVVAVVFASGALKSRPTETEFVSGGVHTQALPRPFALSF